MSAINQVIDYHKDVLPRQLQLQTSLQLKIRELTERYNSLLSALSSLLSVACIAIYAFHLFFLINSNRTEDIELDALSSDDEDNSQFNEDTPSPQSDRAPNWRRTLWIGPTKPSNTENDDSVTCRKIEDHQWRKPGENLEVSDFYHG